METIIEATCSEIFNSFISCKKILDKRASDIAKEFYKLENREPDKFEFFELTVDLEFRVVEFGYGEIVPLLESPRFVNYVTMPFDIFVGDKYIEWFIERYKINSKKQN